MIRASPSPDALSTGLGPDELARVERVVGRLAGAPPVRHAEHYAAAYARANVHRGRMPGATLWVEDHRGIELVSEAVARGFEYRSLGLAGSGDTLLLSRERDLGFERYARDMLGLGNPRVLTLALPPGERATLCTACLEDEGALASLVPPARRSGCLTLVPFRSSGHVWRLARRLAERAGVAAYVAAPAPPLARAANDKLWFADLARALLGTDALPPGSSAHGPAAAAARLAQLAMANERLVLKTPSSAGALGNVVIDSIDIRGRSLREIRARVVDTLAALGWNGPWPVLVGVWEGNVLASPSAQLSIPRTEHGAPLLQGLYEQRPVGERGAFVGATEAAFAPRTMMRLEREALQLASLLQRLGYVGQVSFDALLVGDDERTLRLHWIECNARWGGVSIPMSVLRRLGIPRGERATLIGQIPLADRAIPFSAVLEATAPFAYDRARRRGVVWLTPPAPGSRGLSFVAVGKTLEAATTFAAGVTSVLAPP